MHESSTGFLGRSDGANEEKKRVFTVEDVVQRAA
jgi:hypothetical protein